jgi:hypothetical protein
MTCLFQENGSGRDAISFEEILEKKEGQSYRQMIQNKESREKDIQDEVTLLPLMFREDIFSI